MTKKSHSLLWGTLAGVSLIIIGIVSFINTSQLSNLAIFIVLGILSFTLVSCLILNNNFVGEMMLEIFDWSFVRMPGLIFTLDLDGIVWLLTVKLLFWILGLVLGVLFGALSIALGLVVSLFVYPFAICKEIRETTSTTRIDSDIEE